MVGARSSRLLPDRHGDQARAKVYLVVPLAHEATAMRITDTAGVVLAASGAVSPLSDRRGDVDCAMQRSLPATSSMPGTRTSATATRTTTTRTTSCAPALSADDLANRHAGPSFAKLVEAYFACRRAKGNRTTLYGVATWRDYGAISRALLASVKNVRSRHSARLPTFHDATGRQ